MEEIPFGKEAQAFIDEILKEPGGEHVLKCFQCGTCVAGCPVHAINPDYDPRKLVRMILAGMREEVLRSPEIWLCSTCFTCQDRCPQGVGFTELLMTLRNIASREGLAPTGFKKQAEILDELGRLYEVEDFDIKKRGKQGLPPVQKRIEAVHKLMQTTRLGPLLTKEGEDKGAE